MQLKERIAKELERIQLRGDGLLTPEAVVEFARDPETSLHSQFEWDDGEAAQRWRLHQARNVIRLVVTVIPATGENIRALVSISTDRKTGAGYRALIDILDDESLHEQMLADALADFNVMRRKYATLKKLRAVWDAVDEVATASGNARQAVERSGTAGVDR